MSIMNFMGGGNGPTRYHTDNILASGPAFHFAAGCVLALSLLSIAMGSVLIWIHETADGQCSVVDDDEWLLKFGGAGLGLGIFFLAAVIITWRINWDFVTRFQQQQMHIVASSHLAGTQGAQ